MRLLRSALTIFACLAPLSLSPQSSDPHADTLLAAVKAATGGAQWDRITTWHERGTFRSGDLNGTYETWVDFRHLSSYTEVRHTSAALGVIRRTSGWTGKVAWTADQTGDVRIEESEASRSDAIGTAYFAAYGYLFGTNYPAKFEARSPQTAGGVQFEVVRVTPQNSDPLDLWIDRASHRVLRTAPVTGVDKSATVYSDFRQVAGVTVPFKNVDLGKDSDPLQESQTTSIEINQQPPDGIFDAPQPHFTDITFPPKRDSVSLNVRLVDNQIRVPVSVNGRPLEEFLFDTGSANSIDTSKARALGMKVEIAGKEYGGGTESAVAGLTKVDRLDVGGLRLDNQILETGDSTPPVEGSIGYEVLRRTVVVIDYARLRMTFTKPEVFRPAAQAVALPFRFAGPTLILVEATIDGIPGEFMIDTGSAGSLLILRPFAEQHGLIAKHHATHQARAQGVGGSAPMVLFRPDQFTLGPFRPPTPVGGIFLSQSGAGAMEHIAGNIGNGILKRFTLTLDYAHGKLYFEPNASFREPDVCSIGWSGVTVRKNAVSGRFEVVELDDDGPAAQAGIRKGDSVLAVNGAAVNASTEYDLDEALNPSPGTVVTVTIQRGSDTRKVRVKTRPSV